jgi:hypothetical protein
MKLIKPSFEILEPQGCLKDIELAGRTCYQSQDKISEDNSSAVLFVNNLIKREHYSVIEFGTDLIVRIVDEDTKNSLIEWLLIHNQFTSIDFVYDDDCFLVMRINPRKAFELFYVEDHADLVPSIYEFCRFIQNHLPFLILEKVDFNTDYDGWKQNYDAYELVEFLDEYNIYDDSMLRTETVRIICDRGVTHEIVRQRKCSFAQKSTRYCDEKGEIEFIEPCWDYSVPEDFCNAMSGIENVYKNLRRHGWKPEQARSVLPNSVTTEIVVKATVQQWKHIFKLRCAKGAHPQMREIMIPLEEEFKKRKII